MPSVLLAVLSLVAFATPAAAVRNDQPVHQLEQQRVQQLVDEALSHGPTVERIVRAALAERRTYPMLERLVAAAPKRLSGSPGAAAAVEWARAEMERVGLENVRLEPCLVTHWERGEVESLRIVGPAGQAGESLPILALGGSIATPEAGVTAEVIAVESFEELAERADEARGKIVLFDRPMDPTLVHTFEAYRGAVSQRTRGAVEAAKVGAVAAIVRSMTTRLDDFPHTGGMRYAPDVPRIPTAAVSTNGAERIAALLEAGVDVELHLELSCRQYEDAPSFNVVGELVGRESPDEVVVIGGHLDSWDVGDGAHDDGGPCCQTIAAAALLKSLDLRPRRTIRVVLWMNEENGLKGARAYHRDHLEEMPKHVLALESDSGAFTPRGFRTDAGPEARPVIEAIASHFEPLGATRVFTGGGGADVSPMQQSGVVTIGYVPDGQRYFDLHHSARDTLDQISPRELELGMAMIASMAWIVAELSEPIARNEAAAETR